MTLVVSVESSDTNYGCETDDGSSGSGDDNYIANKTWNM